jgi:hypothetical protein
MTYADNDGKRGRRRELRRPDIFVGSSMAVTEPVETLFTFVKKLNTHAVSRNNLLDTGRGITTAFGAWGTSKMEYVTATRTPKEYSRKHLRPCRSLRLNGLP